MAQGQFGKVYCAIHRQSGQLVALKILDMARSPTQDFLRELSSILALQHPNLIQVYGVEHQPQQRQLILDYGEGGTLRHLIEGIAPLSLPQQLQILIELLAGLDHAHRRNIIHCDVKPENILVSLTPTGWSPRLTDFGIAYNQALPAAQQIASRQGAPAYMAPEQFCGRILPAVDLYAVGIILYEMLLGHRPFRGSPTELQQAHQKAPVELPPKVPLPLQRILRRSLEKVPSRRYPSAQLMAKALSQALQKLHPQSDAPLFLTPGIIPITVPPSQLQRLETSELVPPLALPASLAVWLQPQAQAQGPKDSSREGSGDRLALAPDYSWAALLQHQPRDLSANGAAEAEFRPALHSELRCCRSTGCTPAIALPLPGPPQEILILDRRYGILHCPPLASPPLASPPPGNSPRQEPQNSHLVLFNRRGTVFPPLPLPIALRRCTQGTHANQLLALEQQQPQVLLQISLRPFRLQRIPLSLVPVAIAPCPWGIALIDAQRQLLLLDLSGHPLGTLTLPLASGVPRQLSALGTQAIALTLDPGPPAPRSGDLTSPQHYRVDLQGIDLGLIF